MNFTNREKELLLSNAPVLSRITLYAESGEVLQVFNENDYLVDWDYEDFRYVPDQGFIGQFVERLLDGHLMNIPDTLSLEDKEISVEIAVVDNELEEQVYHNYGRFIITKIEKEDTTGSYKFESSDYTKKFNEVYTSGVTFPCTALKLLNSACDQVGVGLDVTNNTQAVEYVVPKDGLQAGNYHFVVNETYYNFTLSENLVEGNLLMLKGDKLILRKVTSDYNIIREELVYSTSATGSGTLLSDESYGYYELINDDFIVNDNQFTENNTCRDVVRSVAQLSYTWARINENNKLCLDFVKNDNVDSYDEIDTDKYYEATVTGDKVEPINKVLIGMSQVDGENIVKEQDNDLLGVNTIYGETSQETYTGKNLLNYNVNYAQGTTTTISGLTVNFNNDGSITLNGTMNANNIEITGDDNKLKLYVDNTKTYYSLVKVISGSYTNSGTVRPVIAYDCKYNSGGSTYYRNYTLPTTTNSSQLNVTGAEYITRYRIWQDSSLGNTTFNNFRIQLAVYQGDNTTEWEKYVGGIPSPNPDYPQDIVNVSGDNTIKITGKSILKQINSFNVDNATALGLEEGSTSARGGMFLTRNADQSIDVSGRTTADPAQIVMGIGKAGTQSWNYDNCYILPAGTYKVVWEVSNTTNIGIVGWKYTKERGYIGSQTFKAYINTNTSGVETLTVDGKTGVAIGINCAQPNVDVTSANVKIMVIEGDEPDYTYDIYKEQKQKINLPIENLFDKDNANYVNGWIDTTTMRLNTTNGNRMFYISCKPNTTYTISRSIITSSFRTTTYNSTPFPTVTSSNVDYTVPTVIQNNSGTSLTITTGANAKYLVVHYGKIEDTNLNETLASIQIEQGNKANSFTPYGTTPIELCKIGDYQDYITRNTGKNIVDVNNSVYGAILVNDTTGVLDNVASHTAITSEWVPCKPNTTYIISGQNNRSRWQTKDINGIITFVHDNPRITTNSTATYMRVYYYYNGTPTQDISSIKIQIEEGSTATEYEPYGKDRWYLHKEIGKVVLNGSESWTTNGQTEILYEFYTTSVNKAYGFANFYTNKFEVINGQLTSYYQANGRDNNNRINIRVKTSDLTSYSASALQTWLSNNNVEVVYQLATPTNTEITYQPLIDQLNELQNTPLFEGTNHITIDTLNEVPSLDITVTDLEQDNTSYSGKSFEITGHDYDKGGSIYIYDNPLTYTEALRRIAINGAENLFGLTYTPMEVRSIGHPWLTGKEFVKVTNLENQELYFYPFDRKISYSGILTTDLSAQAKNEVAQKYENRNNVVDKINHTEIVVDKANGTIEALSKTVDDNKEEFTQWQSTEYNSLKSTVGEIDRDLNVGDDSIHSRLSSVEQTTTAITNMFQITGGINLIRNSAFLLTDEVWEFTDSGTNPYHTDLGVSYNSALSGQTVSVAEIKARNMKIKSKSENITNLKIDTKYTFNFYHQQDNNMTTTIKMYSTENNSLKAFNDIVITGQQEFKNYEVSFTPTTYTNYTIEIIVTSTSSVGYAYIYDMMLNAGDKQAWQPASDEIYSTTLQMSRLGLKVYSVGDGTITLLGSDGMSTWETSDGVTLGRLVSMRTEAGDRVKTVTTEALYLTKDIRQENANRWVETIVTISGTPYKVEYIESGGQ